MWVPRIGARPPLQCWSLDPSRVEAPCCSAWRARTSSWQIKLDNFVLDSEGADAEVKLIDFGMAARVKPGEETFDVGYTTLLYTAPEMHDVWHMEQQRFGMAFEGVLYTGFRTHMLLLTC